MRAAKSSGNISRALLRQARHSVGDRGIRSWSLGPSWQSHQSDDWQTITMKSVLVTLSVLYLSPLAALHAAEPAEPAVAKIDLFTAAEGGYKLYRIPGIVVTKRGTVLAYCEARLVTTM